MINVQKIISVSYTHLDVYKRQDYDGDTRIVDVHVFKLRTKLQGSNVHIKSSRGVGYLLEELHETA